MSDAICDRCGDDNLTDLPVCPSCRTAVHFPHRLCFCTSCAAAHEQAEQVAEPSLRRMQNAASTVRWSNRDYTEAAVRAGGVLVIRKAA